MSSPAAPVDLGERAADCGCCSIVDTTALREMKERLAAARMACVHPQCARDATGGRTRVMRTGETGAIRSVVRQAVADWNAMGTRKVGLDVSAHIAAALVDAGVRISPPTQRGDA